MRAHEMPSDLRASSPPSAIVCADCGRRIGRLRAHFILRDSRVVCSPQHARYHDAEQIAYEHYTRAAAAYRIGVWP